MSEINPISYINVQNNSISTARVNTTDKSSDFSSCLDKSNKLDHIFERAAAKYNISIDLLKAVAKAESNFNPNAVSKAGAQGVMQLMPATAKELGVVNSFDPEQNIMGGAKYLSGLLKKYDGDVKLSLAAYNAGSGNVRKYGGIPPFKETQNYVVKVMKYMNEDITIPAGKQTAGGVATTPVTKSFSAVKSTVAYSDNINDSYDNSALNALFSYDDYIKLLDLLSKEDEEKDEEKQKKSNIDPIITPSYINLLSN